ncbi:MAG TPA: hypothetical protein VEB22_12070 [Phycisphaerales bacterium]|nr:hypothetical protein [Phycisphaerales bacterium]
MATDPPAYRFVYVNEDGSARELHEQERAYLETEFHPADGDRPYIKRRYGSLDARGDISGYLERTLLPPGTAIAAAPVADPMKRIPPGLHSPLGPVRLPDSRGPKQ